jgi:hypothetical protein
MHVSPGRAVRHRGTGSPSWLWLDRDVAERVRRSAVRVGVQRHVAAVRVAAPELKRRARRHVEAGEPVGRRLLREVEVAPVEAAGGRALGRDRPFPEAGREPGLGGRRRCARQPQRQTRRRRADEQRRRQRSQAFSSKASAWHGVKPTTRPRCRSYWISPPSAFMRGDPRRGG